jgi:hypothetical protein
MVSKIAATARRCEQIDVCSTVEICLGCGFVDNKFCRNVKNLSFGAESRMYFRNKRHCVLAVEGGYSKSRTEVVGCPAACFVRNAYRSI